MRERENLKEITNRKRLAGEYEILTSDNLQFEGNKNFTSGEADNMENSVKGENYIKKGEINE